MHRLGAHYFESCDEFQIKEFEDERTRHLYLVFHDHDRAALTIDLAHQQRSPNQVAHWRFGHL